ncbi:hypothetical protein GF373_14445 [bacterium]|nr:hypothetical protein [bacterium]
MRTDPRRTHNHELDSQLQECLRQHQVPQLTPDEKAEQFNTAWQRSHEPRWAGFYLFNWLRQPSVSFVMGMAVGVVITFLAVTGQLDFAKSVQAQPDIHIERFGQVEVMRGSTINRIYSHIENPAISVETSQASRKKKTVLHGTVNNSAIQVVWNLN